MKQDSLKSIILAGGKSRRFGSDKARVLLHDGRPLIRSLYSCMVDLELNPIIVADTQGKYADLGLENEVDAVLDCGPIGGLYTAHLLFPNHDLLVCTCDMPLVDRELLTILIDQYKTNSGSIFLQTESMLHPFPAIHAAQALAVTGIHLNAKSLRVQDFIRDITDKTIVTLGKSESRKFVNMNYPGDFA